MATVAVPNDLLKWLHKVFDKDPAQVLGLRLQYDGGMVWTVDNNQVLSTQVIGGTGANISIDLTQYTIASLSAFLATQAGYSVPYVANDPSIADLGAVSLIRGSLDISTSNGDHLYVFTSYLWSYLETMSSELARIEDQIPALPLEMSTTSADGEFLDLLGTYFAVPRLQSELDAAYGPRIIATVLREKANNIAIEIAIETFTGQLCSVVDVVDDSPTAPVFNSAFVLNGSQLFNGMSGVPRYGLFDVQYGYDFINGTADLGAFAAIVTNVVAQLRAAGTHMRHLVVTSSSLSDSVTPPTDTFKISVSYVTSDTVISPTDSSDLLLVSYRPRFNGALKFDGTWLFNNPTDTVTDIKGDGPPA